MKIVTAAEMRAIDRATSERFGVPSLVLMENAGTAVANFVIGDYPAAGRIGVVCGKGNNGGDGFVAARKLMEAGREVRLLLLCEPDELRGDAEAMFRKLSSKPVLSRSSEEFKSAAAQAVFESDVLLDAVLGTGFRPPVTGLYGEAIQRFSPVRAPIVAVDIPSGLDADAMDGAAAGPVVPAGATVTFTAPRPAHVFSPLLTGPVVVAPIGSPEEAIQSALNLELITPHDIAEMAAPRPRDSNKGMYGHVLVIGGSLGKSGAAAMAGVAALRAGAGLVTVATAQSVLPTVAGYAPELMTEPLPETEAGTISLRAREYGRLDGIIEGKTVLAIGPGISRQTETSELVRMLVKSSQLPMVLDADGLNAFEGRAQEFIGRPLVITPHPGEMSRLAQLSVKQIQENRLKVAREFATRHGITTVLKGNRTLIAQADGKVWVNPTGNPGMASGGMGDILTGLVAGLLGQTKHATTAVLAAVYLHGLAGDVACEKTGEQSLIATDLLEALPEAFRRVREEAGQLTVRFLA
ncbi:MAG TPA: NAD(P)H-hydrate dehydratase [Terriglobales bacterium]|nr:NAD(P)H-hydrate dehydratase [Terriglobales bacterium]